MLQIEFSESQIPTHGSVVVLCGSDLKLGSQSQALDETCSGVISRAIKTMGFTAKNGEILAIPSPINTELKQVIVLGLGEMEKLNAMAIEKAVGSLAADYSQSGESDLAIMQDVESKSGLSSADIASHIAYAMNVRCYRYEVHKTITPPDTKARLERVNILLPDPSRASENFRDLEPLIEGIAMCRDMVNAPANFLTPTTYADKIAALDTPALGIPGLDIEVLGEQQLKALGMGALLAVGRGSENESQVAILKWKGNPDNDKTDLALVGKGVTFDSGGLSLKPGKGMEDMKTDMGGSAVVVGTLITLARRKAKANVVGIVGLVENMPSHNAYRPSDVITSYSGKTIEVLNTDAEGRLVLADCLSYIEERYQPNSIIDIATLTGAIVMALGQEFGGLFSNSDSLANSLLHAADRSGEPLWQMPLSDAYDKQLDSKVADMINLSLKPGAGSSIAAHFLQRFVSNANWAHLDIAGMVWKDQPNHSQPFGASGYGVRLLDTLVSNDIEAR